MLGKRCEYLSPLDKRITLRTVSRRFFMTLQEHEGLAFLKDETLTAVGMYTA